ncbi:MAG: prepilin-type N-terminal cleavage/methylation domain-containing protein, partial [Phycisphaerales bacterium]|nr:prepilin-type N-terminal cleavage/methylation domain-containing protein [Phycisphaerales bacterium]
MPNHTVRVRSVLGIRGFTLPEVMVVMGVIAVLLAVLLPALSGSLRMGDMTKSLSRMKQIGTWMTLYSGDNRDHIVPSQFNYQDPANP